MLKSLYNLSIHLYILAIRLAARWNPKAKKWINGRKNIFQNIKKEFQPDAPVVWVHAASLGEFEQGRPLIEAIKKQYPTHKIVLTFFSPSGYEIRKNYDAADYICYLPADTPRNVARFLDLIQPDLAIFIKYEFWFNYLNTLKKRNTPTLLVSAVFRPQQVFFRPYGQFFKRMLFCFEHIFVQDEASFNLLSQNGIQNATVVGDTRMDRVWQLSRQASKIPIVDSFKANNELLICGSTWPADEALLFPTFQEIKTTQPNLKFILAPHQIDEAHIQQIEANLSCSNIRYSQANEANVQGIDVLIIDNIGMLSSLYCYGKYAYIGGGFGSGIHNTQEAFVYGLPVIFGPKYNKFKEAVDLVTQGGAFVIQDSKAFEKTLDSLSDETTYATASQVCLDYVQKHKGATERIMTYIEMVNDKMV